MGEEQTIMYPTVCLGCKAHRLGIQEGMATYACGTTIAISFKKRTLQADRSQKCLQGALEPTLRNPAQKELDHG